MFSCFRWLRKRKYEEEEEEVTKISSISEEIEEEDENEIDFNRARLSPILEESEESN